MRGVLKGDIRKDEPVAAIQAANCILRSVEVEHKVSAVQELEERLAELEARGGISRWGR